MIKAVEYQGTKEHGRIDALALAMGFKFEDGQYVRATRKYVRSAPARAKREAPVRAARRSGNHRISSDFYDKVREMTIGSSLDLTQEVDALGISPRKFVQRFMTWRWHQIHRGNGCAYSISRTGGRIIVRRES